MQKLSTWKFDGVPPLISMICALQHDSYCGSPMLSACAANRERKIRERLKKGEDVFGGLGETAVDILDKLQ
jgi:hypothetical protein